MDRKSSNGGGDVSIDVPQNMVGRIIGKGGSNIRDLEYNTGAKIKMGELILFKEEMNNNTWLYK